LAIKTDGSFEEILVHSGQHYDDGLSAQFFQEFDLCEPKYFLEIGSATQNIQIGRCLQSLDPVLVREAPDLVTVFGDTNTTAAAALAAANRNIPVAHVEAGLREFNKLVPEEINKLVTDAVADLYFAPTRTAVDNLVAQGIVDHVYQTGDVTLDLLVGEHTRYLSEQELRSELGLDGPYIFLTCHRVANTETKGRLQAILSALPKAGIPIVFPIHPRTQAAIKKSNLQPYIDGPEWKVLDPIGFWKTQSLIRHAEVVVTDSGGLIKESYFHQVPCVTIDDQTEWVETIEEGWNILAGADRNRIMEAVKSRTKPSEYLESLGNGQAGHKIVTAMNKYLDARR